MLRSHPHGVLYRSIAPFSIGACATFLTESTGFSKQFTGLTANLHSSLLTLNGQFWFPLRREFGFVIATCNSTLSLRNELFDQAAENDEQGVMRMQQRFEWIEWRIRLIWRSIFSMRSIVMHSLIYSRRIKLYNVADDQDINFY
ncbi:hypothetical protein PRIPAC_71877 [Pristionchus pacificus]|uniref:Uncharacterized protein n=1 Tax=Pristionchus pacificus TaxID=54126 RepID=A0A2A6CFE4_PRIPA|nr:hypothetical protein PRIPAC_71877 [Pristionchus pacificus]|eukprot:PDM76965.1 hypothetical protein PRIPAC_42360 [Pristionchus pacificus]